MQRRQEIFRCLAAHGAYPGDQQDTLGNVLAAAAHPPHLPSLLRLPRAAAPGRLEQEIFSRRRQFKGDFFFFFASFRSPLAESGNMGRRQSLVVGPDCLEVNSLLEMQIENPGISSDTGLREDMRRLQMGKLLKHGALGLQGLKIPVTLPNVSWLYCNQSWSFKRDAAVTL